MYLSSISVSEFEFGLTLSAVVEDVHIILINIIDAHACEPSVPAGNSNPSFIWLPVQTCDVGESIIPDGVRYIRRCAILLSPSSETPCGFFRLTELYMMNKNK